MVRCTDHSRALDVYFVEREAARRAASRLPSLFRFLTDVLKLLESTWLCGLTRSGPIRHRCVLVGRCFRGAVPTRCRLRFLNGHQSVLPFPLRASVAYPRLAQMSFVVRPWTGRAGARRVRECVRFLTGVLRPVLRRRPERSRRSRRPSACA